MARPQGTAATSAGAIRDRGYAMVLGIAATILLVLLGNLVLISPVVEFFSQHSLYQQLRLTLAEGATPVAAVDKHNHLVEAGTPVAVMSAPGIGLGRTVIVQGTDAAQTMEGIGHLRDTVMPCQAGSSVLMARSGSYGAIGAKWAKLAPGDEFTMTMGQGTCIYRVLDQRLAGQAAPAPPSGSQGNLVLTTALGRPFAPSGILRVDATLVTSSYPASASVFPATSLPAQENAMATDTTQLWPLVFLLQLVVASVLVGVWMWRRWGRWQSWLVAGSVLTASALAAAANIDLLLPNLM
ncbi:hypothetical protein ACFOYW_17765 [Gryllotalpicola reticulitermitis]|uniref:LPXTG-site transpeptidase (Sortase) family protein n=1 Tax=Gryllotalpicola reticulitermitis TaxID=1184153 RepID=A0ABV8QA83_9MICO